MSYEIAASRSPSDTWSKRQEGAGFSSEIRVSQPKAASPVVGYGFRAVNVQRPAPAKKSTSPKIVRRLHGFFIQEEDTEARVAFVDDGRLVHYYLPLKTLHEGGVTTENQPFELDELEITLDGVVMKGFKIRPSADPRDARVETLNLDDRTRDNLRFILSRAKNAGR